MNFSVYYTDNINRKFLHISAALYAKYMGDSLTRKILAYRKLRFSNRDPRIPSGLSAAPLNAVRIPGGKKSRKKPGKFLGNKKGIPPGN